MIPQQPLLVGRRPLLGRQRPDRRFSSGFGQTPEAAAREVQVAIQVCLVSARDHPIPEARYRPAIHAVRDVAEGR